MTAKLEEPATKSSKPKPKSINTRYLGQDFVGEPTPAQAQMNVPINPPFSGGAMGWPENVSMSQPIQAGKKPLGILDWLLGFIGLILSIGILGLIVGLIWRVAQWVIGLKI